MAGFAAQAAIRSKWTDLIESSSIDVPGEVSEGVRSVVGWLKQASLEVRQAGRRAVSSLGGNMTRDKVVILHYNDVYNIEQVTQTEPIGGAARFSTAVKSFSHLNPLVLFSGDIFSPSMLSTYTKGEQMVPVLNEVGTQCAVFGNHDFDHGLEILSKWVSQCNFPWLMSNVIDNETGRPLGDGKITHVVDWGGRRIGLLGLVEQEWLDTLATINPEEVTFLDYVQAGTKLGAQLKQEGCDYVIALTHMRTPNDMKLAEQCEEIDLILGGHDHVYETILLNGKYIIKSGSDFRNMSKITLNFGKNNRVDLDIEEIQVTSSYAEDPVLKEKLEHYSVFRVIPPCISDLSGRRFGSTIRADVTTMVEGKMDEVLGVFTVPLEGRFQAIRTGESNLGNWICDVVLAATSADLVIINSGTFRSDQVHPAGEFTMRDLSNIIPMQDPLVLLSCTGETVIAALENGVCKHPKLEGRFPQVAGVSFAFDPSQPEGQRVQRQTVRVGDEYLQPDQMYRVAVKKYIYQGCDGYNMFQNCCVLLDDDMCPEIGMAVQNHFNAINMRMGKAKHSKHRQSLITLSRRHSLVKMLDGSELDGPPPLRRASTIDNPPPLSPHAPPPGSAHHRHSAAKMDGAPPLRRCSSVDVPPSPSTVPMGNSTRHRLTRRASLDDLEQQSCQLTPRIEQRIIIINSPQKLNELLAQRSRWESDAVIKEVDDETSP